jgi:hypothetical protein
MNRKLIIGFITVFVVFIILDYLIHNVLLISLYEETEHLWRPAEEMRSWIFLVTGLFFAFFFTLIFSKGYEGRGIMEGFRYGLYVALMVQLPGAYVSYAVTPIPYALALQWFLYGTVQYILLGILLARVYAARTKET